MNVPPQFLPQSAPHLQPRFPARAITVWVKPKIVRHDAWSQAKQMDQAEQLNWRGAAMELIVHLLSFISFSLCTPPADFRPKAGKPNSAAALGPSATWQNCFSDGRLWVLCSKKGLHGFRGVSSGLDSMSKHVMTSAAEPSGWRQNKAQRIEIPIHASISHIPRSS